LAIIGREGLQQFSIAREHEVVADRECIRAWNAARPAHGTVAERDCRQPCRRETAVRIGGEDQVRAVRVVRGEFRRTLERAGPDGSEREDAAARPGSATLSRSNQGK
jgi:hypothetical protein